MSVTQRLRDRYGQEVARLQSAGRARGKPFTVTASFRGSGVMLLKIGTPGVRDPKWRVARRELTAAEMGEHIVALAERGWSDPRPQEARRG